MDSIETQRIISMLESTRSELSQLRAAMRQAGQRLEEALTQLATLDSKVNDIAKQEAFRRHLRALQDAVDSWDGQ